MKLIERVHTTAQRRQARIVMAEAEDERVLRAAAYIQRHSLARLMLIGDPRTIENLCKKHEIQLDLDIHNYTDLTEPGQHAFAAEMVRRRGGEITETEARKLLSSNAKYFAAMLVVMGQADAYIAGNICPTSETIRPALQLLDIDHHFASSYFILRFEQQRYFFADVALNIEPTSEQLAQIGIDTAESARRYGYEPRVAFLSFSTKGSADHPLVEKVRKAVSLAKMKAPRLIIDGELQFDAAFVPEVASRKAPGSPLEGQANVFIFPDLNSGNIAYKIAQRMAGAEAIGPILQGLDAPVNDLSRGCTWEDIVNVVAITAIETGALVMERETDEEAPSSKEKKSKSNGKKNVQKSCAKSGAKNGASEAAS